jgi:hypothetical protein
MDALRKSLNDVGEGRASQPAKGRKPKKAASGQREMLLMAISGKGEARPRAPPRKQSGRHVSARRMKSGDLGIEGLVPKLGTLRRDPEPLSLRKRTAKVMGYLRRKHRTADIRMTAGD